MYESVSPLLVSLVLDATSGAITQDIILQMTAIVLKQVTLLYTSKEAIGNQGVVTVKMCI